MPLVKFNDNVAPGHRARVSEADTRANGGYLLSENNYLARLEQLEKY